MNFSVFTSAEIKPDYKSAAIMWFTKAPYSHAGILVDNTIFHATRIGVHETPYDEFLKTHTIPYLFGVTSFIPNPNQAYGWCKGNVGKDYSESELWAIVLKPLRRFKFFADGKSEMICSEFAARFLNECSTVPVFQKADIDFISPVDFTDAMVNFLKTPNKGV